MSVLGQELRPVLERCPRDTPSLCAKWVRLRQVGETLRQVRETAPSLVRRDTRARPRPPQNFRYLTVAFVTLPLYSDHTVNVCCGIHRM